MTGHPLTIRYLCLIFSGACLGISGCVDNADTADDKVATITPVTVITATNEPMAESVSLNAVSGFLHKNIIKASSSGVIESIDVNPGDEVVKGQIIFTLVTKEAAAYQKSSYADSILNIKGLIIIKSANSGVVSSMAHQKGDYVQEGEELAQVAEQSSLVFILEVPFELREYVKLNSNCKVQINDNRFIDGVIVRKLPVMDVQSQTENYVVNPMTNELLPENLIAKVFIKKNSSVKTQVLPKQSVLSNETLTDFWVMKLVNDSTAVKIPIKKGMESDSMVEILKPFFKSSDRIVLTGNYGLPDTARVIVK